MHFDPTARVSDLGDGLQDTTFRSSRPEVFCKKGVLRFKFRKTHRKTPVSESLF